jgi:Domain of unknown function (DUF5664)
VPVRYTNRLLNPLVNPDYLMDPNNWEWQEVSEPHPGFNDQYLSAQVAENARRRAVEDAFNDDTLTSTERSAKIRHALDTEFTTKDSGERVQFSTGMQRDTDVGKPRWDLIAPAVLPYEATMGYRHAMLMARGAAKYDERNWELAVTPEEYSRFRQSAYRHFMQWYHGQRDEDHAAAVYFNIAGAELVHWKENQ